MASRRFFQAGQKAAQLAEAGRQSLVRGADVGDQVEQTVQIGGLQAYLLPEEVQAVLRLPSLNRVYDLIHQHHLPAHRIGRLYRIPKAEFEAWARGEHLQTQAGPRLVARSDRRRHGGDDTAALDPGQPELVRRKAGA